MASGTYESSPGWNGGARKRVTGLAGARGVMQLLSLAWFVFAAQNMSELEFGLMAGALAIVVLLGAFGDVGLTRTMVLAVAGRPERLWSVFKRAIAVRCLTAVALTAIGVGVIWLFDIGVAAELYLAAAATAFLGGISELVFAGLRAVGKIAIESTVVIVERLAFLGIAIPLVLMGRGAVSVMVVYAATNGASALWGIAQTASTSGRTESKASIRLMDRDGWFTALSTSLVSVGFRVGALVLLVMSTPEAVGLFSLGQRGPEALALLGLAAGGPILAIAQHHMVQNNRRRAIETTVVLATALLCAAAPLFVWFAVRPATFLNLMFDAADREGASTVLVLLAAAGVLWLVRLVGETILLADGKARLYAAILILGLLVNLSIAPVLVRTRGAAGAAAASLAAEVVVVMLAIRALGRIDGVRTRQFLSLAGVASGTAVTLVAMGRGAHPLVETAAVGAWSAVGLVVAWQLLQAIDDPDPVRPEVSPEHSALPRIASRLDRKAG